MFDGPAPTRGIPTPGHASASAPDPGVKTGPLAHLASLVRLGLGTVWSAQVGAETPRGFVLLVGGTPFDVPSPPPAPAGASIVVRVVVDDGVPAFEVVTEPQAQMVNAVARAIVAATLERLASRRLDDQVVARADPLDRGPVRVDLTFPGPASRPRCRVRIGRRPQSGASPSRRTTASPFNRTRHWPTPSRASNSIARSRQSSLPPSPK